MWSRKLLRWGQCLTLKITDVSRHIKGCCSPVCNGLLVYMRTVKRTGTRCWEDVCGCRTEFDIPLVFLDPVLGVK